MSGAAEFIPAQVVDKDDNDVGTLCRESGGTKQNGEQGNEEVASHVKVMSGFSGIRNPAVIEFERRHVRF